MASVILVLTDHIFFLRHPTSTRLPLRRCKFSKFSGGACPWTPRGAKKFWVATSGLAQNFPQLLSLPNLYQVTVSFLYRGNFIPKVCKVLGVFCCFILNISSACTFFISEKFHFKGLQSFLFVLS